MPDPATRLNRNIGLAFKSFLNGNSRLGTPQLSFRISPYVLGIIQPSQKTPHLIWQLQQIHNLRHAGPGHTLLCSNLIQRPNLSIIQHLSPLNRFVDDMLAGPVHSLFFLRTELLDFMTP